MAARVRSDLLGSLKIAFLLRRFSCAILVRRGRCANCFGFRYLQIIFINEVSMWKREITKATWNGVPFNIRQTTLDTCKRLHVVELPYVDEPYIKVMGAKSKGVNLEAVFVGATSLVDANAFVAELESTPMGTLEHPYLGELSLVYQSASQSFNTKKGLVTLSLKFLKQGGDITLINSVVDKKTIEQLADVVIEASGAQFVKDIAAASPDEVSSLMDDFYDVLNVLKRVANKISAVNTKLVSFFNQIQDGINAVTTILNAPATFASLVSGLVGELVSTLSDEDTVAASSPEAVLDLNRSAASLLRNTITTSTTTTSLASAHCNIQITVACVLLSNELALVAGDESLELATFADSSVNDVASDIDVISGLLDDRLDEVTQAADYESLELVEAITALRESVIAQRNKITTLIESVGEVNVYRDLPLLAIAQNQECTISEIASLNVIAHPLFVNGLLRVPHE